MGTVSSYVSDSTLQGVLVRSTILRSVRNYTCRGCGTVITYPERFRKCPVCGIKGGW